MRAIDIQNRYESLNISLSKFPYKRIEIEVEKSSQNETVIYLWPRWKENTEYHIGDVIGYNAVWFKCTEDHTSDLIFDDTKWTDDLKDVENVAYKANVKLAKEEELEDIAKNLLQVVDGLTIIPYKADNAILNPASQIGDVIKIGEISSLIMNRTVEYGIFTTTSLEIPYSDETEHEFEYKSETEKSAARDAAEFKAQLNILADQIASVVEGTVHTYRCTFAQLPSGLHAGDLWYNIEDYIPSGETEILYNANTWYRYSGSEWEKTTNSINVAPDWVSGQYYEYKDAVTHDSKWYLCKVEAWENEKLYKVGDVVGYEEKWYKCIEEHTSSYDIFDPSKWEEISLETFDPQYWIETTTLSQLSSSQITQTMNQIKLEVNSDSSGSYIALREGDIEISSPVVDMHVKSVNIDGTITADYLVANSTITGPEIIGGEMVAGDNTASIYLSNEGLRIATEHKENVISLGYDTIDELDMPIILLGEGGTSGVNKGMIKKYTRGIFIGDNDDQTGGRTRPEAGDGIFIDFYTHQIQKCVEGNLSDIGVAVFG